MRLMFIPAVLLLGATPAFAQPPAAPARQLPPQLTDPAMPKKLANTAQALSSAFLDLPVGELQAAVEGREPTAADRKRTLRDLARRDDPNFERNVRQQIAEARPKIERGMRALSDAWPSMMEGLQKAQKSIERAAANMPDPTYPTR
jgi:hypothetical protein